MSKLTLQIERKDPGPTRDFVRGQVGALVDKGGNISKEVSKGGLLALVPAALSSLGSIFEYLGLPKGICEPLTGLSPKAGADFCDPSLDPSIAKTSEVAKNSLYKASDASVNSGYFFYNVFVGWFGKG